MAHGSHLDCGASPPSLPSGGMMSPFMYELLPRPFSAAVWRLISSHCTLTPQQESLNLFPLVFHLSILYFCILHLNQGLLTCIYLNTVVPQASFFSHGMVVWFDWSCVLDKCSWPYNQFYMNCTLYGVFGYLLYDIYMHCFVPCFG